MDKSKSSASIGGGFLSIKYIQIHKHIHFVHVLNLDLRAQSDCAAALSAPTEHRVGLLHLSALLAPHITVFLCVSL